MTPIFAPPPSSPSPKDPGSSPAASPGGTAQDGAGTLPPAPSALGQVQPARPRRPAPRMRPGNLPPARRRKRSGRHKALVGGGVVLTIVALVLGGGWIFTRWADAQDYRHEPGLAASIDLSTLSGPEPVAFASSGRTVLSAGGRSIMRVAHDHGEALVALGGSSTTTLPQWVTPLPDELTGADLNCTASSGVLDCGAQVQLDLGTGAYTDPPPLTTPPPTAAAEDDADATKPPPAAPSTPSGDEAAPSVRLGETSSDEAPIISPSGAVTTSDGTAIAGLTLDPLAPTWAAQAKVARRVGAFRIPGSQAAWVISDGTTLAAVKGKELLWSRPLPEGAAGLNGLGGQDEPSWLVMGGTLIMAQSDGVVATSIADGTETWRITTPVTSWLPSKDRILIANNGQVALLSPEEGLPRADGIAPSAPAAAPGLDSLGDSTLDIPADCAPVGAPSADGATSSATFVGGVATAETAGEQEEVGAPPSVTITSVTPTTIVGKPVALAVLSCSGGGNTTRSTVAAYDEDGSYMGALPSDQLDAIGHTPNLLIESLHAVGSTVFFHVPGIQMAGDQGCQACSGSATATATAQWNGSGMDVVDVLYDTPAGGLRIPPLPDVQAFYDAIAAQDYTTASQHADDKLLGALNQQVTNPAAEGQFTLRTMQFPKGGTVTGCSLAGPGTITVGQGTVAATGVQPGEVICAVSSDDPALPWLHPIQDASGATSYTVWMVLTAGTDGSFEAVRFERAGA
ncbi:hypothetical protein NSA19_10390 [Actinomyces bowdenii]|uniref:hypothetical protein n=1 Tax=Actinomyces bowdenii TaxID=131109 RepID=UPI00214C1867|nr:hypothetical protein [Actinomyces bowdenii]MCR2053236.1 hypothetical protein [Actinomyces bowdenii]